MNGEWKEVYDRFFKIELQQEEIQRRLQELERQMKAWKKKFPGS